MLRDITIGQYYPAKSCIHRLDPRTKIVGTILYIVSLFLFRSFSGFLVVGTAFAGVLILSRVPFRYMLRGLRPILMLLAFTVLCNFFLTSGEVVWQWKFLKITKEGLERGAFMGVRLILLIFGTSLMTYTTTPNQLTDGLERLLSPLKVIHFPAHEMAMMMSIALRFIPILTEEADRIRKAQMARGADMESGGPIKRAKAMIPVFIPLLVSAFRRAFDLAMAMEARCYHGGKGRTKMKPLRYHMADLFGYVYLACYMATIITLRIWLKI
ncbi:MAG: energy-coupling factor transporter transmembrane protein EcfT [Lachnospiraceae bacterium]|nr:energy-coupling factor transporter transmembrane protein EcfT [Lachnospiraceae bacterium]